MLIKDRIIMMVAFAYCNLWHRLRCQLFRRIEDFNYHVFAISSDTKGKFFQKLVEVNDDYEKTVSVKISNICVRYSFDKTIRNGDVVNTNTKPEWLIQRAVVGDNFKNPHHNSTVVKLTKRGSDVTTRDSNI